MQVQQTTKVGQHTINKIFLTGKCYYLTHKQIINGMISSRPWAEDKQLLFNRIKKNKFT